MKVEDGSRALVIVPSDLTGGSERTLMNFTNEMALRGWIIDVFILSTHLEQSIWDNMKAGVRVTKIDARREFFGAIYLFFFFFLNRANTYDLSFTSHLHCNAFVSVLQKLRIIKVRTIYLRESTNFFRWFSGLKLKIIWFSYYFYSKDGYVICQTNNMRNELISNVGFFEKRSVTVVNNPVDMVALDQLTQDPVNWLDVFPHLEDDAIILLSVGRLVEEKAFDVLFEALTLLPSNFKVAVVGSGPLENHLKQICHTLGVEKQVAFLGHKTNPYQFMKSADCCVVSSRLEGFPNTLLEKMAVARNVVSTNCAEGISKLPGIEVCEIDAPLSLAAAIKHRIFLPRGHSLSDLKLRRDYLESRSVSAFVDELLKR